MSVLNLFLVCFCAGLQIHCSSDSPNEDISIKQPELEVLDPVAIPKTNNTKLYMHYMTWFETNESSSNKQWGYHWTMANKDPNRTDANGKREIASHFYPLIGPYHSGDAAVIENHLLLMKYAGVDGVLIDWYGTYNVNDYAMILENTNQVIAMLDKVGLDYAIVYEDRFLQNIVDANLAPTQASAAKQDMRYLQNQYFTNANYIHVNNQPLLLNFGPVTLKTPELWTDVFSVFNAKPTFLTLWNQSYEAGANAQGEFAWVYQNNSFLSDFYTNTAPNLNLAFGAAYPGFKDFYKEGGATDHIGFEIPHNNCATLTETLNLAAQAQVDYLQLVTWNDFGEGTMLEPTLEFGYTALNTIAQFSGVSTKSVFEPISELYRLRKAHSENSTIQKQLDQVFYYFVAMQPEQAITLLNTLQ